MLPETNELRRLKNTSKWLMPSRRKLDCELCLLRRPESVQELGPFARKFRACRINFPVHVSTSLPADRARRVLRVPRFVIDRAFSFVQSFGPGHSFWANSRALRSAELLLRRTAPFGFLAPPPTKHSDSPRRSWERPRSVENHRPGARKS
jgi:hypothetical protein